MGEKKKVIGFLGGTFDPIHHGHIQLALEVKEKFCFDEMILCPAFFSPFKEAQQPHASAEHRYKMTCLAIEGIKGFSVLEDEIKRKTPSYTIDTIKELKKKNPLCEIHLILGEDQLKDFFKWKEYQLLLEIAPIKVGSRFMQKDFLEDVHQHVDFFKIHNLEISSTYLRERLAQGLYSKHLIPPKVVDYIHEHGLYLTH